MVDTLVIHIWQGITIPYTRDDHPDEDPVNSMRFDHAAISLEARDSGVVQAFTTNPPADIPLVFPTQARSTLRQFTASLGQPTSIFRITQSKENEPTLGATSALSGLSSWFGAAAINMTGTIPVTRTYMPPAISRWKRGDSMSMAAFAAGRFGGRINAGLDLIPGFKRTAGRGRTSTLTAPSNAMLVRLGASVDGSVELSEVRTRVSRERIMVNCPNGRAAPLISWLRGSYDTSSSVRCSRSR